MIGAVVVAVEASIGPRGLIWKDRTVRQTSKTFACIAVGARKARSHPPDSQRGVVAMSRLLLQSQTSSRSPCGQTLLERALMSSTSNRTPYITPIEGKKQKNRRLPGLTSLTWTTFGLPEPLLREHRLGSRTLYCHRYEGSSVRPIRAVIHLN